MSFDPATQDLSINATANVALGATVVNMIVDDPEGGTCTQKLTVTVAANTAPTITAAAFTQLFTSATSTQTHSGSVADTETPNASTVVTVSGLPAFLGVFTYTYPTFSISNTTTMVAGVYNMTVIATDGVNTVTAPWIGTYNQVPTVANPITNIVDATNFIVDHPYVYTIPDNLFQDLDPADNVVVTFSTAGAAPAVGADTYVLNANGTLTITAALTHTLF
jgi:hypothetical protein